jgi:phosphinothricin acetyltransferase
MAPFFRLVEEGDAAGVLAIYAPFCDCTPVSFELQAPPLEEIRRRIRTITQYYPWIVCDWDGEVAGYVYASQHRERAAYQWSAEVSAYIRERRRRIGLGRALYTALFKVLALQGFYKAYAGTTLPNPGSIGLHRAMGFEPVGVYHGVGYKLEAWHDVAWWQLALQSPVLSPAPPRSIRSLLDTPELAEALAAGLKLLKHSEESS